MASALLQTFGSLSLRDAQGQGLKFPQKGLLLLAYLALSGRGRIGRDEASVLLWSDLERSVRHTNLRKTISRIREAQAAAGLPVLSVSDEAIWLPPETTLTVDAALLDTEDAPLRDMTELLRRPFPGDAEVPFGDFHRWVLAQQRHHLQRLRTRLLRAQECGDAPVSAVREAAFFLLEREPQDEVVRRCLSGQPKAPETGVGPSEPVTALQPAPRRTPGLTQLASPAASAVEPIYTPLSTLKAVIAPPPVSAALPRLALLPPVLKPGAHKSVAGTVGALIEDITISLCALRHVAVVAPYTAQRIQQSSEKVDVLAKHSVSYLVDTALSAEDLFVQIIFVPLDHIIWAQHFSIEGQWAAHRRTIASVIADCIAEQLRQHEQPLADYERHPEAYHAYLTGLQQTTRLTLQAIRSARRGFRQALYLNPEFSHAYSGLARTFSLEWILTAHGDKTLLARAEENSRLAIERQPELAVGHKELGVAKLYLGQIDESLEALARAEELSPNYADAIYSYADSLVHASRPAEALEKLEKAMRLNPMSPDMYYWSAAGASFFVGRYQDAVDYIARMAEQASADRLRAASFAMLGDLKMARRYRRKDRQANPHFDLEKWLAVVPIREQWQKDLYRDALHRAGY
ncbi:hypothetical protein BTR14_16105 [Rhizobium rhizosphaerae]|uniref:Uncharacterized protein n=1 Tax=Xaviernesmea rhizosphaerae TaxID=1672749 RepID=A0ABX3PAC5_9HYPH|nr:hypothetical protein [Xaviernesmea rhizosphaerae]OQP85413.1 hypothetical protein BTR14_16105 [Xaviernesmea rhizosphaerae]